MGKKSKLGIAAFITVLSVVLVKSVSSQQQPRYLALITDITGEVVVRKAQRVDFKKAVWGMQLYQGDRVKTLEASEVSLLFSNNNLIAVGPNSTLTISEGPVSPNNSPKPVKSMNTELFADLSNLALRRTSEGEIGALAGLRYSGSEEIVLLSPRHSKIKTNQPSFVWNTKREFDKFKVKLFDSNGLFWTQEVSQTKLDYPEDEQPLEYGGSYFWQVEGEGLFESSKSHSVGFSALTLEELQAVQSQEQRLKEMFKDELNSSNFHFILGVYYDKKGLLEAAISEFQMISELNIDAPLPHEILGKLYNDIGLKDQAISELQSALKLSQKE